MCFGGGSQTVTQKSTPELPKQYESILNTGANIDQDWIRWLKGDNGELDHADYAKTVAGLTPDQLSSNQMIRDLAGSGDYKNQMNSALGMIGQGGGMTGEAGQMVKSAMGQPDINAFFNPYQKDVVDTTLGAMDKRTAEQKAQLLASQAGKRAFGSGSDISTSLFNRDAEDRAAQTLAQLQQSGWNTALGAAQNQQKTQLQGAQQYGALGAQQGALGTQYGQQAVALQQGQLSAASALGQSGLNQQNFNQFALDRPLNLAQQHIGMVSGAPVGTTSKQQVPTPSPFSQILGAGLAGASMFLKDGGRVRHAFANGGMVDMAEWSELPTDQILFMLQKMDPSDPNRDIVAEVYSRRQRDEGSRPTPRSAFDNGRVQDVPDATMDPRNTQDFRPALPTDMRQPSAFEQGEAGRAAAMADDARKRRMTAQAAPPQDTGDSFLGGAPAFDMLPPMASGGEGGLSFSGKPGQKLTFPKMADAVDNLVSATPPASALGPRKPSSGGLSFDKRRGMAPSALGPTGAPSTPSVPSALGTPANEDNPSSGGGLGDRIRGAMDNPLFWIGLGLMSSKNPNFLGALGEGVGGGISAFSSRESDKAKQKREEQKSAHELAMENAKFGLQQTTAKNQMDLGRQRLQLAERADQRAARTANRPSALQEKIAAMKQMGASAEEIKRAVAGFKPEDDAEAQKQAFILDGMKKDPYGDPLALGEAFDGAMVSGASDSDLMSAAGF